MKVVLPLTLYRGLFPPLYLCVYSVPPLAAPFSGLGFYSNHAICMDGESWQSHKYDKKSLCCIGDGLRPELGKQKEFSYMLLLQRKDIAGRV